MRRMLTGIAVLASFLVGFGFLGQIHRSADAIAMLRPILAVAVFLGMCTARTQWLKLFFGVVVLGSVATIAPLFLQQEAGGDIRVYSKNLGYWNANIAEVAADIEATGVDIVVLQEVSQRNALIMELLKTNFPHQHLCKFSGKIGIALLSQHPFGAEPECSNHRAIAAVPILFKEQRFWIVSAHIPWPWPHDSLANETATNKILANLTGPIVVAGDFNIMPWSGRVTRIASMTKTRLAGPVRPTFWVKHLPLPLDFMLAPGGGTVEVRPLLGSDHAGIVGDLKLFPQ
jgi:endonuclease/exonuclease/phosphatase (EEP) superfamily protein YafD